MTYVEFYYDLYPSQTRINKGFFNHRNQVYNQDYNQVYNQAIYQEGEGWLDRM